MDKLKKEIKDELSRPRLDKTRLYDLLFKIVNEIGSTPAQVEAGPRGERGERGERGLPGTRGEKGEPGVCKCECVTKKSRTTKKTVEPEPEPEQ